MSRSVIFRNDQRGSASQVPSPLCNNNSGGSCSREGSLEGGDDKDEEIARLKRAYHDAVVENSNKKASTKTNT